MNNRTPRKKSGSRKRSDRLSHKRSDRRSHKRSDRRSHKRSDRRSHKRSDRRSHKRSDRRSHKKGVDGTNKQNKPKRSARKKQKRSARKKQKRSARKNTSKILNKQRGGIILPIVVGGVVATTAAVAYAGFRLVNMINDKSYVNAILTSPIIDYLPKVKVIETKEFMDQYLFCISTVQLFTLILSREELLTSKTIHSIIMDVSHKHKDDSGMSNLNSLIKDYHSFKGGPQVEEEDKDEEDKEEEDKGEEDKEEEDKEDLPVITKLSGNQLGGFMESEELLEFKPDPTEITFSKNIDVIKLGSYLLSTAKEPGKEGVEYSDRQTTPYLSVRDVNWYNVIITGLYDEDFTESVNDLLKERGSLFLFDEKSLDTASRQLSMVKNTNEFDNCIRKKMRECCTKPRGQMDYISSKISWDSNNKCLSCAGGGCLIYIYDFYYNFLLEDTANISVIDKIYMLILCEARICILSRCICLEAIRIQDEQIGVANNILTDIYLSDSKMGLKFATPPERYSKMARSLVDTSKSSQHGGADPGAGPGAGPSAGPGPDPGPVPGSGPVIKPVDASGIGDSISGAIDAASNFIGGPAVPEPAVPVPAVPEPTVPEPAVPAVPEPVEPEPVVPEPVEPESAVPEPVVPEPVVPEPVVPVVSVGPVGPVGAMVEAVVDAVSEDVADPSNDLTVDVKEDVIETDDSRFDKKYLIDELKAIIEGDSTKKSEYTVFFGIDEALEGNEFYKAIESSVNFRTCELALNNPMDTMDTMNEERIKSFMELFSANPELLTFITPQIIARKVFKISSSDIKLRLKEALGEEIESSVSDPNFTYILQFACLCYLHRTEIHTNNISILKDNIKSALFQELVFLLFENNGDNDKNVKLLKQLCEHMEGNELTFLQEKLNLVTLLPDEDSKLFDNLLDVVVDPLQVRQEELTKKRMTESSDKKYEKSQDCKESEKLFKSQLLNKEPISINKEDLLRMKHCGA